MISNKSMYGSISILLYSRTNFEVGGDGGVYVTRRLFQEKNNNTTNLTTRCPLKMPARN